MGCQGAHPPNAAQASKNDHSGTLSAIGSSRSIGDGDSSSSVSTSRVGEAFNGRHVSGSYGNIDVEGVQRATTGAGSQRSPCAMGTNSQDGDVVAAQNSRAGISGGRLPPDGRACLLEDGRTSPLSPATTRPAYASVAVAPAWCGDTTILEDLLCWTKGLDFDAAVEGY